MFKKGLLIFNTIRYLKLRQLVYQTWYRINKSKSLKEYKSDSSFDDISPLEFALQPPETIVINEGRNRFIFLNLEKDFGDTIDWDFQEFGKLWNYNLQYAGFLNDPQLEFDRKKELIQSLYTSLWSGTILPEPYPASLRSINVIRFCCSNPNATKDLLPFLHAEFSFLANRLEYHLLANHLLENFFSLMMGGAYFNNTGWIKKAENGLREQIKEQILPDGGHFELSPMYHQIILFRMMELIDWYSEWDKKEIDFENFLRQKASAMLTWIKLISFNNGDIPHFNDSAIGIAPNTNWLFNYGNVLNLIHLKDSVLNESGYRRFNFGNYECRVDVAKIGASYQPGHAHADALSFILYVNNRPFLVEQGTSTYQIGSRRNLERSTAAHNTVVVNNASQSEVWGGFRVANRADVHIETEQLNSILASHNGYSKYGVVHSRKFEFSSTSIIVTDELLGNESMGVAFFHIHPFCTEIADRFADILVFENADNVTKFDYQLAEGYNNYLTGTRVAVAFKNHLVTTIYTKRLQK